MNQTLNRYLLQLGCGGHAPSNSSGLIVPLIRLAVDLAQQPFDVGLREPLAKPTVEGREDADEGVGAVLQHRIRLLRGDAELPLQKDDELSPRVWVLKHDLGRAAEIAVGINATGRKQIALRAPHNASLN
ncbi:hypothetical protein [Mesorhizobium sp. L2C084A000]|uniref:hypothetical protein n=1 Tax=unclassified Mesorhizobium TaxID=325217 RepID=UPI0012DF8ABE|nr:hypothetical protein [Mesorhizobium sp. L2C084A000]